MKLIMKRVLILMLLLIVACESDDGSSNTGNTDEYFKYTINGVERVFDYQVESHRETQSNSIIHSYEISALGLRSDGEFRRVAATFFFDGNGTFMPTNTYEWGYTFPNDLTPRFYFAESTMSNFFLIEADFAMHPITATVTSAIPSNVGDYIEFTFTGMYKDQNGVMQPISGECRAQRDADQNF